MGIYLGQLPPAEMARFKAELAETLVANFCYPRFFDYRTDSLQTRPVDRTKRQDVWLYLSSFDFTAWNRVDLLSADLSLQIERLFIQFVQRNRSFFGNQGRRRMSDIRALISSCAAAVAEGLRNHLTGQRPNNPPFGSPRPVVSWSALPISGKPESSWEQISASTMVLQQQLQELRGEAKTSFPSDTHQPQGVASGSRRAPSHPQSPVLPASTGNLPGAAEFESAITQQPTMPTTPVGQRPAARVTPETPAAVRKSGPVVVPTEAPVRSRRSGTLAPPSEPVTPARKSEPLVATVTPFVAATPSAPSAPVKSPASRDRGSTLPESGGAHAPRPISARGMPASSNGRDVMNVGEDDIAIFEQMRHQLVLWLRLEAVTAGLEISGQAPAQLLEMLRQQSRHDETRLQVVSTLLNLANQVIKTGTVTVLDYKQALMFHLMHTRRS